MTTAPLAPARRPIVVSIAVALIYVSGILDVVVGTLVLLSRYRVDASDVLSVSLLGAGIILFGLLSLAAASAISRGSRLARLLLTIYLGVQIALHVVTIIASDVSDLGAALDILLEGFVLVAVWAPPGSRFFRVARGSAAAS